jgi:RNA polymerase sigma-70 factor (ECF subfamily)
VPEVSLDALEVAELHNCCCAPCDDGAIGTSIEPIGQAAWTEKIAAGDAAALEAMIERYQPRIVRLVERLLAWPGDAADVVQDVFLSAIEARATFRGQSKLETWLVRIAINTCRAHNRRRCLRRKLFAAWRGPRLELEDAEATSREISTDKPSPAPPDRIAIDREHAELVRQAVAKLPQKYREAVVLYYLEEMTAAEAAAALGIRTNAVEVRLSRARQRLAGVLSTLQSEIR